MKRKAKIKEIKVFYTFKPTINIWTSKSKGKSNGFPLLDETWYDGYSFNGGYFLFIQLRFFAVHISIKWWKFKLFQRKR